MGDSLHASIISPVDFRRDRGKFKSTIRSTLRYPFIQVSPDENDGARLADALHDLERDEDVIDLLGRIEGP